MAQLDQKAREGKMVHQAVLDKREKLASKVTKALLANPDCQVVPDLQDLMAKRETRGIRVLPELVFLAPVVRKEIKALRASLASKVFKAKME